MIDNKIKNYLVQYTTYIAEKTVRPLRSAIAVVSAIVVIACIHKRDKVDNQTLRSVPVA